MLQILILDNTFKITRIINNLSYEGKLFLISPLAKTFHIHKNKKHINKRFHTRMCLHHYTI